MITLLNGKGQLGEQLKKDISNIKNVESYDAYIYHTWNVLDKTKPTQVEEYEKFKKFVDSHINDRVIFISTLSENETSYRDYKLLSEKYLLEKCKNSIVVRLPIIIGKGIISDFKNNKRKPYGKMNIISLKNASKSILNLFNKEIDHGDVVKCYSHTKGENMNPRILECRGEEVSAELIYNITQVK